MNGKIMIIVIALSSVIMGGAIYYAQVYAYYYPVEPVAGQDVTLVSQATGQPEAIAYEDFQGIDADSSPIRYRACFTTSADPAMLRETYVAAPDMEPRMAPGWFDCFDGETIGAGIESGSAVTYLGAKNIAYGVDRIVAIFEDGRGYVWHELNDCGAKAYDGTVTGEACPERPEAGDGG